MKYVLLGNAPNSADAAIKATESADIIIQHNTCDYAEHLPQISVNYVFVTNAQRHADKIINRLLLLQQTPVFTTTRVVFARNPFFYTLKKYVTSAENYPEWRNFKLDERWDAVRRIWPTETISFMSSVRLELTLLKLGMERWHMPSTGMIAYDWASRRLQPGDCLLTEGFRFDYWRGHPRDIEKELIKPIVEEQA